MQRNSGTVAIMCGKLLQLFSCIDIEKVNSPFPPDFFGFSFSTASIYYSAFI